MRRARAALVMLLPIGWVICGGGSLASDAIDPAPSELAALMERFAGSGGVRVRFRELRHLSILTDPIETTGRVYFAPPDRLARHTTWPDRSSVVVEAGRVSVGDETGQRVFDFDTSEVARALVGNLMIVFRGDLESLKARYSITFDSAGENWTLDLEPRSRAVRGIIDRIRFTGRNRELSAMETHETNGDRTIMRFDEIELGLAWEQGDLDRIFSLDPPDAAP
jgi:outer membrane lipoprotein-sorting protein